MAVRDFFGDCEAGARQMRGRLPGGCGFPCRVAAASARRTSANL